MGWRGLDPGGPAPAITDHPSCIRSCWEAVVRMKPRSPHGSAGSPGSPWVCYTPGVWLQPGRTGLFQPFSKLPVHVHAQLFCLWLPALFCCPCNPQPLRLSPSPETPFLGVHQKCIRTHCLLLYVPLVFCSSLAQCVKQIGLICKTVSSLGDSGSHIVSISYSVTAPSLVCTQEMLQN